MTPEEQWARRNCTMFSLTAGSANVDRTALKQLVQRAEMVDDLAMHVRRLAYLLKWTKNRG